MICSFLFLVSAIFPLTHCFSSKTVPDGIVYYEDGIVIRNLETETQIITIELPFYETQLLNSVQNLNISQKIKKNLENHVKEYGRRLDKHLESQILIWGQEFSMKDLTNAEIDRFYKETPNSTTIDVSRRVRRHPVAIAIGAVAGVVIVGATAVITGINFAQIAEIKSRTTAHAKAIMDLDNAMNEVDDVQLVAFVLNHITTASNLQMSDLVDELEMLRYSRFPAKLMPADYLRTIIQKTTSGTLVYPLRMLESKVLVVDERQHKIRILVNVPIMKKLHYAKRFKVDNIGYNHNGCRKYFRTSAYLAYYHSGLRAVDGRYCTIATRSAMKCDDVAFLSTKECWPPSPSCGEQTRCSSQKHEIIKHTPIGYLVSFTNMTQVLWKNQVFKTLNDSSENYLVNLEPHELLIVDGTVVSKLQADVVQTTADFDIPLENITSTQEDFSKNITAIEEAQMDLTKKVEDMKAIKFDLEENVQAEDFKFYGTIVALTALSTIIICIIIYILLKYVNKPGRSKQVFSSPADHKEMGSDRAAETAKIDNDNNTSSPMKFCTCTIHSEVPATAPPMIPMYQRTSQKRLKSYV